jgi:hypothetical protein
MNVQAVFNSITKKPLNKYNFLLCGCHNKIARHSMSSYIYSYMYRRAPHLPAGLLRVHRGEAVVGAVLPGILFVIFISHTKYTGTFVITRL